MYLFSGPDISVSAYFGFCRALCISPDIQEVVSVRDWITLLLKMFDLSVLLNNFNTGGNAFLIKVKYFSMLLYLINDIQIPKKKLNVYTIYNYICSKDFLI